MFPWARWAIHVGLLLLLPPLQDKALQWDLRRKARSLAAPEEGPTKHLLNYERRFRRCGKKGFGSSAEPRNPKLLNSLSLSPKVRKSTLALLGKAAATTKPFAAFTLSQMPLKGTPPAQNENHRSLASSTSGCKPGLILQSQLGLNLLKSPAYIIFLFEVSFTRLLTLTHTSTSGLFDLFVFLLPLGRTETARLVLRFKKLKSNAKSDRVRV